MKEPRKVVTRKFKNAGIPSIKIPLNIARRNRQLDSRCIITVMIPELMPPGICCKNIVNKYKWVIP